jgi:hypothetical protein
MSATPFTNKLGDEFAYEELKRIVADAHSHGTRMIFLFVSHRFNWTDNPARIAYLKSLGADVITFPRSLLVDPKYWVDEGHLSADASQIFTRYFIEQERKLIGQGEHSAFDHGQSPALQQ